MDIAKCDFFVVVLEFYRLKDNNIENIIRIFALNERLRVMIYLLKVRK